jgi:hypothetical protein
LRQLFKEVNRWLSDAGIYLKEGTIVDATIIEATSSTKNKAKKETLRCSKHKKVSSGSLA